MKSCNNVERNVKQKTSTRFIAPQIHFFPFLSPFLSNLISSSEDCWRWCWQWKHNNGLRRQLLNARAFLSLFSHDAEIDSQALSCTRKLFRLPSAPRLLRYVFSASHSSHPRSSEKTSWSRGEQFSDIKMLTRRFRQRQLKISTHKRWK
jgi:hypothetical protein